MGKTSLPMPPAAMAEQLRYDWGVTEKQLTTSDDDRQLLAEASECCGRMTKAIGQTVVGQDRVVRLMLVGVLAHGHVLLVGVPGLAKTLLVKTLSQLLGWRYKRIQFTPDMMPADIIGMELLQEDAGGGGRAMQFVPGPVFTNLLLADEINRTPPKTQSALLEAMAELNVTSLGKDYRLERPFVVFATQNPIEQEGTYPLPEAQLDRFMMSVEVGYPSEVEEQAVVNLTTGAAAGDGAADLEQVVSLEQMMSYCDLVRRVPVSEHVVDYAVKLARATRPVEGGGSGLSRFIEEHVRWGAGPRGPQQLVLAAKALAVMAGQPTVSCQMVREVAKPVLRHRILPSYQAMAGGVSADDIVDRVLEAVGEPRYG